MKISFNWLKDYINNLPGEESLANELTFAGIEVEKVHSNSLNFPNVVVAQILKSEQHPNADRLSVTQVDDGSGQPPRQIVCGAKNYKVGDKVALALPGAKLPGDIKIKSGKLRGVESEGMMCSTKELGLPEIPGSEHGIWILPNESKLGIPISELFPADTIFDLEITPNRPDLLSYLGIARELSVKHPRTITTPPVSTETLRKSVTSPEKLNIFIAENVAAACPLYSAVLITGVKVGPSPEWLQTKLEAVGLRSINNVVDITNFVMREMGQPLHAFDADKVRVSQDEKASLQIRFAKENEKFKALDNKEYNLSSDFLVIANGSGSKEALALAGIMGGVDTGVTDSTTSIILESAYFQPQLIRKSARNLGLHSDSSYRFERGVDPSQIEKASARAIELIQQLAGGHVETSNIEKTNFYETITNPVIVKFRYSRCDQLLGFHLDPNYIDKIFTKLGLEKITELPESTWRIPSFRSDLKREIDLIEEVSRIEGLEKVSVTANSIFVPSSAADRVYDQEMKIRDRLAQIGFSEIKTMTLISDKALRSHGYFVNSKGENPVQLKNPISEEHTVLRPSLIPGLIAVGSNNARAGQAELRLFEIGPVFSSSASNKSSTESEERLKLSVLISAPVSAESWKYNFSNNQNIETDFADLRGICERLVQNKVEFKKTSSSELSLMVEIYAASENKNQPQLIGFAGQLNNPDAKTLDFRFPVLLAELDLQMILDSENLKLPHFIPISKFPAIQRDFAILVDNSISNSQIESILQSAKEPLLTKIELFDIFTDPKGERIPAEKKSLAYRLTYRSDERTLRAEEVTTIHERLKDRIAKNIQVQFRE